MFKVYYVTESLKGNRHKPFWVLRTATYISKSVRDDRSASRYWFNSLTCKKYLLNQSLWQPVSQWCLIKSRLAHIIEKVFANNNYPWQRGNDNEPREIRQVLNINFDFVNWPSLASHKIFLLIMTLHPQISFPDSCFLLPGKWRQLSLLNDQIIQGQSLLQQLLKQGIWVYVEVLTFSRVTEININLHSQIPIQSGQCHQYY